MGNRSSSIRTDALNQSQGRLYDNCEWDDRTVRRSIRRGMLGPRMKGLEDCTADTEECPICFLHYPSLNKAMCCKKRLCTECLLQLKPPNPTRSSPCPFCNAKNLNTQFFGPQTRQERLVIEQEDRRVEELQAKIRQEELERPKSLSLSPFPTPLPQSTTRPASQSAPAIQPPSPPTEVVRRRSRVPYNEAPPQPRRTTTPPRPRPGETAVNRNTFSPWDDIFSLNSLQSSDLEQLFIEIAIQNSLADMQSSHQLVSGTIPSEVPIASDNESSGDDGGARVPAHDSDQDHDHGRSTDGSDTADSFVHEVSDASNDLSEANDNGENDVDPSTNAVSGSYINDHASGLLVVEPTGGSYASLSLLAVNGQ